MDYGANSFIPIDTFPVFEGNVIFSDMESHMYIPYQSLI